MVHARSCALFYLNSDRLRAHKLVECAAFLLGAEMRIAALDIAYVERLLCRVGALQALQQSANPGPPASTFNSHFLSLTIFLTFHISIMSMTMVQTVPVATATSAAIAPATAIQGITCFCAYLALSHLTRERRVPAGAGLALGSGAPVSGMPAGAGRVLGSGAAAMDLSSDVSVGAARPTALRLHAL